MSKVCTKCKIEKELGEFPPRGTGTHSWCKGCFRDYQREYWRKNSDRKKRISRLSYVKHRDDKLKKHSKYREENRERIREYGKGYYLRTREEHIEAGRIRTKERRHHDVQFRLRGNFSRYFGQQMIKNVIAGVTTNRIIQRLGYTWGDVIRHLESQFYNHPFTGEIMSWDNYGKRWEIDHIIPVSSFKFSSWEDGEFKKCWALTNLQPLWKEFNRSKHDKIDWKHPIKGVVNGD